ncbi:MAG TPA: hypothetical protein EYH30_07230 [Anaerolineales bacterium]|nr:hypothetical protein [Anaerolineae bacterium]HIQ01908.1 hypothetical protein [Anaerolineales bacterium]
MNRLLFPTLLSLALLALVGLAFQPAAAGPADVTPLPPVQNPDGRAGTCYSFYYDPPEGPDRPFIPLAREAGSRWDRFDFSWPTIEPTNDNWNFGPHDDLVDDLQDGGIENIVGILLWTPDWVATGGTTALSLPRFDRRSPGWYAPVPRTGVARQAASAQSSPPQGLYLPWDHPDNYWGNYVNTVVSHFGDRVKYWEMWNEPEWEYFWTGTSADYAQLLKVGYLATKAACPDCTVLFGGLHYWANPAFYRWVLNTLNDDPDAPANNYFFDVMSVHLYSRSSNAYDVVNTIRSGMLEFVPEHPIWLTETGVPVWDDDLVDPDPTKYDYAATQEEAAAYVIQSYAEAWASGVERYFFFRTHDADMSEYFGLIRNDRSLRPAYVAFQVATTYLVSPTMTTRVDDPDGTRRVTLWGTPWGKLSVLWNRTPTTATFGYPAILPTATLVDRWGVTQTISATAGVYTLTLPGATANLVDDPDDPNDSDDPDDYIIGGEPYLVIEADTTPPTATVHPLPAVSYYTIPVSWEGADDATGVWLYDIQVREGVNGGWTSWLDLTTATSALYFGDQHDEMYCFRARAWDNAGNHGEWPIGAQACTTLDLSRRVHLDLEAIFGDANSNGVWDGGEITLTQVSLRFVDGAGADAVTPTVGASWEFTASLMPGDYTLVAVPDGWPSPPPGWLPRWLPLVVEAGGGVQEIWIEGLGLLPHNASRYLPVVMANQ